MADFIKGLPGWVWAGLMTTAVLVSWFFAGFGVGDFMPLWATVGPEFLAYAAGLVTTWLGYRWAKGKRVPPPTEV